MLSELYEVGRSAWPDLSLDRATFERFLEERVALGVAPEKTRAQAADLYLACACAHGAAGAVERFDRAHLAGLAAVVARVDPSPAFTDEVRQRLRTKLFVAEAGAIPKIAEYTGRGPLLSWVRVAALRTALNLK